MVLGDVSCRNFQYPEATVTVDKKEMQKIAFTRNGAEKRLMNKLVFFHNFCSSFLIFNIFILFYLQGGGQQGFFVG